MKVLHYVNENNLTWVASWISLLRKLGELGTDNVVICKGGGSLSAMLQTSSIRHVEANVFFADLPATARGFASAVRRENPDIIHTRLSSGARIGGWWGKKLGIPVLSTLDKFAKLKYYKDCTMLAACSSEVRSNIIERGFPEEKSVIIHNPIDSQRFKRDDFERLRMRQELGIQKDQLLIAAAGRFDDGKGFMTLMEAYGKFYKAQTKFPSKLLLLGDGPQKARLNEKAQMLGITGNIIFPGFVTDVRPWLWASDIFVFPSDKPDAFGLSLLEAMAAGLPVAATDCGGPGELIDDEKNGLLVPMGDSANLQKAILRLTTEPPLRTYLGKNAALRAGDFRVSSIATATMECYRQILHQRKCLK